MEIKKSLENKFNTSLANLTGSPIREFDAFASTIEGIIKLTLGEPDFDTAEEVKEAAKVALDNNRTHYSVNNGIEPLRAAWDKNLEKRYDLFFISYFLFLSPNSQSYTLLFCHILRKIKNPPFQAGFLLCF